MGSDPIASDLDEPSQQGRIERRQRGEEPLQQGLRELVVGMVRPLGRAAAIPQVPDLVPGRGLGWEALRQLRLLLGHVEAVQPVEEGEAVAVGGELRLPCVPCRLHAAGRHGLDQHHTRTVPLEIDAGQDLGLRTLDVDLEEVDAGEPCLLDQGRERAHGQTHGREARAEFPCARCVLAHGGGEPVQLVDDVELGFPLGPAGEAAGGMIARAHMGVDVGQRLLGLHDQPAPALEVEPERHVVGHGMPAADIDVGAHLLPGEHQVQVVVLEVLRVGELHGLASGFRGRVSGAAGARGHRPLAFLGRGLLRYRHRAIALIPST